jgi:MFS family permease
VPREDLSRGRRLVVLVTLICAPLSGRLVGRYGARPSLVVAGVALIAGGLLLTRLSPTTGQSYLLTAYFIFGLGVGMVNPPITDTAVSGMPPSQAGVAAAVASTSRQVGMTLGVAVLGAVGGSIAGPVGHSFAAATRPAWWLTVALGAIVLVLGVLTTSTRAMRTAERTAADTRLTHPAELLAS